jgi:hypothetical protein
MDRLPIFRADRTFRFTICPLADFGKGSSACHSHDGMQQGIAGFTAYCFSGEVSISENLKKVPEIRGTFELSGARASAAAIC